MSTIIVGLVILLVVVWTLFKNSKKDISFDANPQKTTAPIKKPAKVQPHVVIEPTLDVVRPTSQASTVIETPEAHMPLSEQDMFVQSMISKAQQDSVAIIQGEPHQAELSFEDEEKPTWDHLVKESFEKRVNKKSQPVEVNASDGMLPHAEQVSTATTVIPDAVLMPSPLLMIHIMAPRSKQFSGEAIMQACSRRGLTHGEHEVFHSYGINGKVLYRLVSAMKPGTFPLSAMETFKTSGLSMVMDMESLDHPRSVFKSMIETAHAISEELGGDILDERHERLTALTVSDYLARIKTYTSLRQQHERSEA